VLLMEEETHGRAREASKPFGDQEAGGVGGTGAPCRYWTKTGRETTFAGKEKSTVLRGDRGEANPMLLSKNNHLRGEGRAHPRLGEDRLTSRGDAWGKSGERLLAAENGRLG